jgi:hypothetical protein
LILIFAEISYNKDFQAEIRFLQYGEIRAIIENIRVARERTRSASVSGRDPEGESAIARERCSTGQRPPWVYPDGETKRAAAGSASPN